MKSFDPKCYELSAHFLADEPMNDTVDAERYRNALACHIQAEVESWILYERLAFDERGGSPNEPRKNWGAQMSATPADHSFHFDPNDDPCPSCDTQMAGELNCPNCMLEHPDRYYEVNDEMIERAWAAIVGFDVAGQCFVASLTRADLRAGIVAALAFANRKPSAGSQLEGVASVNSDAREAGDTSTMTTHGATS